MSKFIYLCIFLTLLYAARVSSVDIGNFEREFLSSLDTDKRIPQQTRITGTDYLRVIQGSSKHHTRESKNVNRHLLAAYLRASKKQIPALKKYSKGIS